MVSIHNYADLFISKSLLIFLKATVHMYVFKNVFFSRLSCSVTLAVYISKTERLEYRTMIIFI